MVAVLIVVVAICMVLPPMLRTSEVTKSTVDREPLPKQYVTMSTRWFEDQIGWIRSPASVERGMRYFYDKTGVQPYLVLTEDIHGDYSPTGQAVWDYGNEVYNELFSDEGHLVFVFQCQDNSTQYNMAGVTGAMAKTVVDEEALEILYDYFDHYFNSDVSDDEMFSLSFQKAADRMMTRTPSYGWMAILAIAVIVILIVVFLVLRLIYRRRKEEAEETERILSTPIDRL